MKKTWKSAVALMFAGVLLLTGCGGAGDGSRSSGETGKEAASMPQEAGSTDAAKDEDDVLADEENAVKIGIPAAKADPDSPDKEETVHVKADAGGSVTEVKVDNVLHVYDTDEVTDVSELDGIHNSEGDEDFRQDGSDLAWQNLGSDIKYEGSSDREVPVGVTVTYWLDGQEIVPSDLAGQSGHVRIRFDYENRTSMTVAVNDKSYNVKVPFVVMTAMVLPEDSFAHIKVTNGRCMSFEGQNMVLGYAIPGLADSLQLEEFEPTEEVEIPSYVEVECDAQDFELSFTATVVTNGLFKDIKDDDLDDIDELTDNMKELNDATSEMVDGAGKLLEGTETFESGLAEYVSAVSQVSSGMSQLSSGLTVAGVTGDQKLEDILNSLAADAKVLADAMVTLKGENEWEKVFEDMQSYVTLVQSSYMGAETELAQAEAEYENLSESIADRTGSGQLTEGISQFNSGIDALYSGAVLLTQGTSALESYGSPLLEGASALTEGMSALHDGIKAFDEEAIQELTDLAGDDLLNLSGRIRAIKICDTSYQTFSGLAPGRKGTVKFIIETEEIVKD